MGDLTGTPSDHDFQPAYDGTGKFTGMQCTKCLCWTSVDQLRAMAKANKSKKRCQ